MKNEELKIIYSAYFPYDLKIGFEGEDLEHSLVGLDSTIEGVMLISPYGDFGRADIQKCKPILWDLSYLTKEIEHEGRRFIPMRMLKNGGTDLNEYRFLEWKGYSAIDNEQHETCYCPKTMSFYQFYMGDSRMCTGQYEKMQMLLEWHFNIFNLPESEYINKATITNK
ncbi:hypothetical protein [Chryseobacterium sp. JV274]|uniref:hypothetical protein n=1 Tax=Chryseobacterium sp. JV274 TaxID=1932669 RepID=UPI000985DECA|nr:hypothetical protein [Chryseobacterium sp. JV274]